jgi:uncharacterized surface protein with fasciclin (FAS1) repeats
MGCGGRDIALDVTAHRRKSGAFRAEFHRDARLETALGSSACLLKPAEVGPFQPQGYYMSPTRFFTAAAAAALIAAPAFAQENAPAAAANPAAAPTEAPAAPAQADAAPAPAPAASQAKPVVANGDLVDTLKLSGQFTTFVKGIDSTNLTQLLKTNKNLTVFAPTDAAFAAMPAGKLAALQSDKTAMQHFILHHVVNAPIPSSKIKGAKGPIPTGAGDSILLDGSAESGELKVDGATIVQPDIQTGSGLLQVVDHVLIAGQGQTTSSAEAAAPQNPGV